MFSWSLPPGYNRWLEYVNVFFLFCFFKPFVKHYRKGYCSTLVRSFFPGMEGNVNCSASRELHNHFGPFVIYWLGVAPVYTQCDWDRRWTDEKGVTRANLSGSLLPRCSSAWGHMTAASTGWNRVLKYTESSSAPAWSLVTCSQNNWTYMK